MSYGSREELLGRLSALVEENDRVDGAIKVEEKGIHVNAEDAKHFRKNLAEMNEIKAAIADIDGQAEFKRFLSEPVAPSAAQAAAAAAEAGQGTGRMPAEIKSIAEMFTDSEEFKALLKSGADRMPAPWSIEGKMVPSLLRGAYGVKDVYAGSGEGRGDDWSNHGFGSVQFDPMVPRSMRRARVRDLFPVAQTSANLIDFFRVIGFGSDRLDLASSASMVPDYSSGNFGLKPQSELTFESAQAPVRTIAHYELAHRNVLEDEPQLQSTINNELLYGLRLTEDNQILNGTGNGDDLLGILRTPGIQSYAEADGPASDTHADAIRRAATKAMLAYLDPTGVVVHPYDWEAIELTKGSDEHYAIAMNVTVGAEARLWRTNVVDSPAIAEGTGLVGAFGLGAQLYDRMQANIRIAEQHADLFVRNAVAILAEERLALAVKRPESFVKVTFAANEH